MSIPCQRTYEKRAEPGATANEHVRHGPCLRTLRAGHARGRSITLGKIYEDSHDTRQANRHLFTDDVDYHAHPNREDDDDAASDAADDTGPAECEYTEKSDAR